MKFKRILSMLLAVVTVAASALALASCQKSDKKTIGVIQFAEFTALQNAYKGFVDGLKEAGYEDGKNITILFKSAGADTNNCPTIANYMVSKQCDLIYAIATPSVSSAMQKTSKTPIIFSSVTDAVASGIVNSNEVPGKNISGVSDLNPVERQIDLLVKLVPEAKKVAVLYCSSESNSKAQYDLAKAELDKRGITCVEKTISEVSEIQAVVSSMKGEVDAMYIPTDNTLADAISAVSAAAIEAGLPVIAGEQGMVEGGSLGTVGIDYYELGKEAAKMAIDVLYNGADISTMPVRFQSADKQSLVINKTTAQKLGLTIPEDVLAEAEIVE